MRSQIPTLHKLCSKCFQWTGGPRTEVEKTSRVKQALTLCLHNNVLLRPKRHGGLDTNAWRATRGEGNVGVKYAVVELLFLEWSFSLTVERRNEWNLPGWFP